MFIYILLACFLVPMSNADLYWEDCGGQDAILKIHDIVLSDPIRIGKNDPIRITINSTQMTEISGESRVDIKIHKNLRILGQNLPIDVPCMNGTGSCEMSLCEIFSVHRKLVCAILDSAGQECKCPTDPGVYVANYVLYSLKLDDVPYEFLAIGSGEYSLEMKISHEQKELACMKLTFDVRYG